MCWCMIPSAFYFYEPVRETVSCPVVPEVLVMFTASQLPEDMPTAVTPLVPAEVVAVPEVAAVEENDPGVP